MIENNIRFMTSKRHSFRLENASQEDEMKLEDLQCRYMLYNKNQNGNINGFIAFTANKTTVGVTKMMPKFTKVWVTESRTIQLVSALKVGTYYERGDCPKYQDSRKLIDSVNYARIKYICWECDKTQKIGVKCTACGALQLWCRSCGPGSYHMWEQCLDNIEIKNQSD